MFPVSLTLILAEIKKLNPSQVRAVRWTLSSPAAVPVSPVPGWAVCPRGSDGRGWSPHPPAPFSPPQPCVMADGLPSGAEGAWGAHWCCCTWHRLGPWAQCCCWLSLPSFGGTHLQRLLQGAGVSPEGSQCSWLWDRDMLRAAPGAGVPLSLGVLLEPG